MNKACPVANLGKSGQALAADGERIQAPSTDNRRNINGEKRGGAEGRTGQRGAGLWRPVKTTI